MLINILILVAPISVLTSAFGLYEKRHEHKEPLWLKYSQMTALLSISLLIIFLWGVPHFLLALTAFVCLISLLDVVYLAKKRTVLGQAPCETVDFSRSFIWIALVIFIVRSFIVQPYHVPTSSLYPTIWAGDFLLVLQYPYGIKMPISNKTLVPIGSPKRGDIVVFDPPEEYKKMLAQDKIYVKRVIGLPGDTIEFRNDILFINGNPQAQTPDTNIQVHDGRQYMIENLEGIDHKIVIDPNPNRDASRNMLSYTVPDHHYFLVGDNRNNSSDSRVFQSVDESKLMGKAVLVWLNWKSPFNINLNRIGKTLIPSSHQSTT